MRTYDFQDRENEKLYEYLYRKIRTDILSGEIPPGSRMPSKRTFAANLGVSVITVETAYAQLCAEGYLRSKPRSGFYAAHIDEAVLLPAAGGGEGAGAESSFAAGGGEGAGAERTFAASGGEGPAAEGSFAANAFPERIDLAESSAPAGTFPFPVWNKLTREILSTRQKELLERSPGQGILPLREAIAAFLMQYQDLYVSPDQIVIGAGTEYLYGLIIRLLGQDKIYAVETPGYLKTARIYQSSRVQVRGIPMDSGGMDVEKLRESGADVIHISPSHQFPTGITMPVTRRSELLAWCRESMSGNENGDGAGIHPGRRYIIEDEYDSEFRLAGRPIPALMSIDGSGSVIYLNTFTKSVAPTIRIAYMVLPEGLMREYREKLGFYSCTVSSLQQYVLAEFMLRGHFDRHINRMRNYSREKRDRLTEAIRQSGLGRHVTVHGADAGLHFLLEVDSELSEEELTARAAGCGVRIFGLGRFYLPEADGDIGAATQGRIPEEDTGAAAEGQTREKAQKTFAQGITKGRPRMVVSYQGLTDEQTEIAPKLLERAWFGRAAKR